MRCPQCNEANTPQGSLSHTNHYRCRACGWWYSQTRRKARTWTPDPRNGYRAHVSGKRP